MSDVIRLLPETIANQIAAGEVIQRPASVVKELLENSIDAKASKIELIIKNGGKDLIRVIDNGVGMSQTDARLCFERHATSKIKTVDDLYNIKTKGFRGEALASIAAVSKVELKTKREQDNIGTRVVIEGGKFILQEPVETQKGAIFSVKSLFFNVPARRRFLKTEQTEYRHVLTEFLRVAIPHFDIEFKFKSNDNLIYFLKPSSLKERILNVFDKSYSKFLIPINAQTKTVKISGFISKPQAAKKTKAEQYFFVNKRFMKNSYFARAVLEGYGQLLPNDAKPIYFIFFEIDPKLIDVNIHPTKTEINFENATQVYSLLSTAVRQALTHFEIVPSIDFDNAPFYMMDFDQQEVKIPEKKVNKNFSSPLDFIPKKEKTKDDFDLNIPEKWLEQPTKQENHTNNSLLLNDKFLLTKLKNSLLIINVPRAIEQINYEELLISLDDNLPSQTTLYPVKIDLTPEETSILEQNFDNFKNIGFQIVKLSANSFNIVGVPNILDINSAVEFVFEALNYFKEAEQDLLFFNKQKLAAILAKSSAKFFTLNSVKDQQDLLSKLFSCQSVDFTYDGRRIVKRLDFDEIEKIFEN